MTSPLKIQIALWYWCRTDDYSSDDIHHRFSPACKEIYNQFLKEELLVEAKEGVNGPTYKAGPALECYVDALCAIPFPVQQWVIPDAQRILG